MHLPQHTGQHLATDGVDTSGPRLGLQRALHGFREILAWHDGSGPKALQVVRGFRASRYASDLMAKTRKDGRRHGADAACRAGDKDRTVADLQPVVLERHDGEHCREPGGANRHRLAGIDPCRERHQPIGLDLCLLRIAAPPDLAHTPAGEHDLVAWLITLIFGRFDGTGEVDAGNMGVCF